jgi:hypothetical protein
MLGFEDGGVLSDQIASDLSDESPSRRLGWGCLKSLMTFLPFLLYGG